MKNNNPVLVATNLTFSYPEKIIWENANFEVNRGEFIGLLGPNGAGKSSLLSLILGLSKPHSGDITIFGNKPTRGNNRIGYVPQGRSIDSESHIEALEYVRLGISGTKLGFSLIREAQKERETAYQSLVDVDAQNLAHRSLGELSGGELQRIFLAQALVSRPDLLLLDEPLANLDIRRETQLIQLISSIVKKQNIATILIAHNINPLLPVVDRIIYIANGKIASGKPDEIISNKKLSELYDAPIEVIRGNSGQIAVLGVEEVLHHDL